MTNEIHQNDIGTTFRATLYNDTTLLDISNATARTLVFKKPDGTILNATATFYTDGTDGIIQYIAASGDVNQSGEWFIQADISISGSVFHSDIQRFTVYRNLE
jgi:hypothetical protein